MKGTLSVLGLYRWDNTLFDLMALPNGMEKETLIDFILAECSDMEVLYPNPEVLKNLIGIWSHTEQFTWNKLYNSLLFEYNPIDNYDRSETRILESSAEGTSTDSGSDTITSSDSGSDTTTSTDSGTDTATSTDSGSDTTTSTDSGTDTATSTDSGSDTATSTDSGSDSTLAGSTDTKQVKSFNTADGVWTDKEKDIVSNTGSTTYGKTNTNTAQYGKVNTEVTQHGKVNTEVTQHGKVNTEVAQYGKVNTEVTQHGKVNTEVTQYGKENQNTYDKNDTETIHARGNIGTVTTQKMISEEREIALFNIYQVILDSFKQRFCLLVY